MKHVSWITSILIAGVVAATVHRTQEPRPPADADPIEIYRWDQLRAQLADSEHRYLPFLNRTTLTSGLYSLPVGATDTQNPHDQDEVYYVVSGKGTFRSGEVAESVGAGSIIFVAAHAEHRFVEITEQLDMLVFFSTAPVD